jgi:DnaK suppressor protein
MDNKKKDEVKTKILEEIEKTEKAIVEFREMARPVAPDDAIGRISRMDAINNKSVAEASLRKNKEKLKQLNYMLQHVNDTDFGLCAKCKSAIPLGRMLLMPQSRFCINCAG